MAELIREIVPEDLPQVKDILGRVFGDDGSYEDIQRLGGMTNHSYKVTRADGEYVVRIPGEGTEEMINRADERKSTELACSLGIDSELLWFGDDGTKVMRFIPDPLPLDEAVMRKPENLQQAAAIFKTLHTCGKDTGVRFEVFEMADLYERIIREAGTAFYDDYDDVRGTVMSIKEAEDAQGEAPRVPCHNDSLVGNWVLRGDGKLFLIDWEYSGMNLAMWDLSCRSIECAYGPSEDEALLEAYYGRTPSVDERRQLAAAKLYVDYLWTLWGLTRIPYDGEFMQEYADGRYERLKANIEAYRSIA